MNIVKMIFGWIAQFAIPKAIKYIEKLPNKYGKATKESNDVYKMVKKFVDDDGYIDQDEIMKLAPEVTEAFIAIYNLIDPKLQIRIKKK